MDLEHCLHCLHFGILHCLHCLHLEPTHHAWRLLRRSDHPGSAVDSVRARPWNAQACRDGSAVRYTPPAPVPIIRIDAVLALRLVR
jgi:hypothetical protein